MVIAWVSISLLAGCGLVIWWTTRPDSQVVALDEQVSGFVIAEELVLEHQARLSSENDLLIPAAVLSDHLGYPLYLERTDDELFVVWPVSGALVETEILSGESWLNEESIDLLAPALLIDDEIYVSADFISRLTGAAFTHHPDAGRVEVHVPGETIIEAQLKATQPPEGTVTSMIHKLQSSVAEVLGTEADDSIDVRAEATTQSPTVFRASTGDTVRLVGEKEGWFRVIISGVIGYVPVTTVANPAARVYQPPERHREFPPPTEWTEHSAAEALAGERVRLVWEMISHRTPDPQTLQPLQGVNVVSPTWFHLEDEQGRLRNLADHRYVQWAHQQGVRVWGLVTNSFDPELTSAVLNDRDARRNLIRQLLLYAEMYELDGINIDFENVFYEDRDMLTHFAREITPLAHARGLTVSIDVTVHSTSRTWSMCYDRRALAEVVDYVILMGYDEHTAGSRSPGPVSSLPWVERGLVGVLAEVPADKLVLGVPFYIRVWEEYEDASGDSQLETRAIGISRFEQQYADRLDLLEWDPQAAQHYLEYTEEGRTYRIWVEDEYSMQARMSLIHKYDLAGVAAWRRGLESPWVWDLIEDSMTRWP